MWSWQTTYKFLHGYALTEVLLVQDSRPKTYHESASVSYVVFALCSVPQELILLRKVSRTLHSPRVEPLRFLLCKLLRNDRLFLEHGEI